MMYRQILTKRPFLGLTVIYAAWKSFLLAIALGATSGSSYDTSTSLYFERVYGNHSRIVEPSVRLTRWDAIYFMHASKNGKLYEQEWAFGWGLSVVVSSTRSLLELVGLPDAALFEPLIAIVVAHITHLLTVLSLYQLSMVLFGSRRLGILSGVLHILSPAGLFLSAPYAESPFAFLTMLGNLLFAYAAGSTRSIGRPLLFASAGLVFGLSSLFRSNGIASGLLFAVQLAHSLLGPPRELSVAKILDLASTVVGGLLVAMGTLVPQFLAWQRYCHAVDGSEDLRPWCSDTLPSIFKFVQEEYWDVGFLKYWTLNQLPLFFLAAPVLWLLISSSTSLLRNPLLHPVTNGTKAVWPVSTVIRSLAGMQLVIAILAITNYHVQIITRMASAYPVWYWWIASSVLDERRQKWSLNIATFMVMYASIQGALFASFLPPA